MTTTKQYDYLNRLTQMSSQPAASGLPPVTFNCNYNSANQRTRDALTDGSYWVYQYDSLGQVTSGHKLFADGTPVPGQQFDYSFDTIGNRTQTKAGGDQTGGNQRMANYSANNLNQITQRDYPGTNDVVGAALATNTVVVNGQTAFHKGEYFWGMAKTNNTSAPQWVGVTVASGGITNTGNIYFPQTPEHFSYDADGNLTNDGRWAYTWDSENRLIGMTVNTNVGPQYQLTFGYDFQGRRVQKIVSTWNPSTLNYQPSTTNLFAYDGWNLIATLNHQLSTINTFVWGSDLSGSMQGAGGVGGLLEISYYGASTTNAFVAYDGNGNVSALVNAADGTSVAQYDYDPFLGIIRATGPMAYLMPFLGSTKYYDWESGLYYYGYRYLRDGWWVSRDPLMELGSRIFRSRRPLASLTGIPPSIGKNINDYVLLQNTPLNDVDARGLCSSGCGPDITRPLTMTLLHVAQDFWRKNVAQQIWAGVRMYDFYYGPNDWDIIPIHYASVTGGSQFGHVSCGPGYGTYPCPRSLTFQGECYFASAINYSLWGKMNELENESEELYGYGDPTDFPLLKAIITADLWKWHKGDPWNGIMMTQVDAFVTWGYTGKFSKPLTLPCGGSSCEVTDKTFDYVWGGIHGTPTGR